MIDAILHLDSFVVLMYLYIISLFGPYALKSLLHPWTSRLLFLKSFCTWEITLIDIDDINSDACCISSFPG